PHNGGRGRTRSGARAVMGACAELMTKVSELAGGWPSGAAALANLLARTGEITAEFRSEPNKEERAKLSFQSFGAVFVEADVDSLGQARIKRVAGVYDVGRMVNPRLARSQLMGGITFGIGMALMEATLPDENVGRVLNANMAEYHVPVSVDAPEFDIDFINEPDPHMSDLGVRGV